MKIDDLVGNPLLDTDSYKASHFFQYPSDTQGLYAYLEARKGARYPRTMVFGIQAVLNRFFDWGSATLNKDEVLAAGEFWKAHGEPFNEAGWMKVVDKHGGRLPLHIRAVPEGLVIPVDLPLITVESTDPELWWLVTYVESMLMKVWYPMTVATRSFYAKQVIRKYLEKTSDSPESELPFKLHDFGYRGVSSDESAEIGGMAHLVNFMGTDTAKAIVTANMHYPSENDEFKMHGFSIPAMEHSSIITWGRGGEVESFRNMLRQCKQRNFKLVACVSDTYDFFNAVENIWCGTLLQEVKDSGMTVVVRPDSGDPTAVNVEALRIFARKLGSEMKVNSKGYLVLPDYFRLIQGDGNDDETSIEKVLKGITDAQFSASNIAFGMGGGLLQKLDRDTQRFAYKPSAVNRNGVWHDARKAPQTDLTKASKGGRITTYQNKTFSDDFQYDLRTAPQAYEGYNWTDIMHTVYRDGSLINAESFETVRKRAGEQR